MDYSIILGLIGGLGLFLYGMKLMSEGLEKAAGAKMRSILEFFTKNRFIGMLIRYPGQCRLSAGLRSQTSAPAS